MLAAIALCVATGILVKSGKLKHAWITGLPLAWLVHHHQHARSWEKLASNDLRIGFLAAANDLSAKLAAGTLPPEKAAIAPQLIFNLQLDAALALFFVGPVVADRARHAARLHARHLNGKPVPPLSEAPHQLTQLEEAWQRD